MIRIITGSSYHPRGWLRALPLDAGEAKRAALREQIETLVALAAIHGEDHPLVIEARAAWLRGDALRMGDAIRKLQGG